MVTRQNDPFWGLRRIGIDEISYKRRHRYLTVVVDHDSGRLVWAAVGRDKKTLRGFFDLSAKSAVPRSPSSPRTGRSGSRTSSRERCVNATLCIDPLRGIPRNGSYVQRRIMRTGFERRAFGLPRGLIAVTA